MQEARVSISAIEPRRDGGAHLVCVRPEEAEKMRQVFAGKLITGVVRHFRFYRAQGSCDWTAARASLVSDLANRAPCPTIVSQASAELNAP